MPNTIAQNLARLVASKTAIADAIVAKGGTVDANDGFEEFPIAIGTIPSGGGGGEATSTGVRFLDYDGTILHTYTPEQFSELTEMPENPTHTGLTSQGWNWSLADAKTYVATYKCLDIGQTYITDDGNTRLYITLNEGRLSPVLGLCPNGTLTVDWGDGSSTETMTGSSVTTLVYLTHTYNNAGNYTITITPNNNSTFGFGQRNNGSTVLCKTSSDSLINRYVYLNSLYKVELGNGVTSIGNGVFANCYSLTSITIPDGVTSIGNIAFQECDSLIFITIPDNVISIGNTAFFGCYSLTSITMPHSITSIGTNLFYYCHSLTSITIPPNVTSIGDNVFQYCYSLTSITIPDGVTSIGTNVCSGCHSLASITIPEGVTSIGNNAFSDCYSLTSITMPDSITSIGNNAFTTCHSLTSITMPDSITSIGTTTFSNCYSLSSITIPPNVTSIGNTAFFGCYGLGFIKFTRQTLPTISSSNSFGNVPTDCIIYTPALVVNLYMDGTNYPNKSTYTYIGYATYSLGDTLPDKTTDETYSLTWYATVDDLKTQTNPITVGNGNEVYATATAI